MFYTNVALIGDNILYRGVKDGKRVRQKIRYKPKFFVRSSKGSKWTNLQKEPLEEIQLGSIREARDFLKQYEGVSNFKIYGNIKYEYAFISDVFPEDINWDMSQICTAYIDIEVGSENGFPEPNKANEAITAITVLLNGKYHTFGCGNYETHREDVEYIKCSDEYELIEKFLDFWTLYYPDIVTGWNINFFDIPYLINRVIKLYGEEKAQKFSPWGKISSREVVYKGKTQQTYDIMGVSVLDYYELFRNGSLNSSNANQESYALGHIASVVLGETKLDYSEFENLHQLYKLDYQKFIEYNVKDVELVSRLEDKLGLIEVACTLAYDSKVNVEDVFTQVRMWDVIIYNKLKQRHIAVPPRKETRKDEQYAGAFVKDPILGMHRWVASFDLNSLYPHLIMMYNLSPETLLEAYEFDSELRDFMAKWSPKINVDGLLNEQVPTEILKKHKITMTPNGQFFRTDKQGFLSEIMETMYEDRAMYKRKMIECKKQIEKTVSESERKSLEKDISRYHNLQMAKKITLNSAYGAIGNQWFRFFDIRIAEAITLSGQLSIKWIENKMNDYLNRILKTKSDYVIASDTDSIYLNLGPLIDKALNNKPTDQLSVIRMLDKFCEEKIQPHIDDSYQNLADYVNAYAQKMKMKREALADKGIWTAKKRYLLNVYNNEGVEYAKPKLKITGLEAIKSSTPSACREKIKEALEVIVNKDQATTLQFIKDFREEFKTLPVDEIAFPRGVNGLSKYSDDKTIFGLKTPIHVRGSLIFNHLIIQNGLEKKYQLIKEGEKIKFIYLREPNTIRSDVISFMSVIPKELDLNKYIDYNTQFEKSFVEPLKAVLDVIGWKAEEANSLEDLFS